MCEDEEGKSSRCVRLREGGQVICFTSHDPTSRLHGAKKFHNRAFRPIVWIARRGTHLLPLCMECDAVGWLRDKHGTIRPNKGATKWATPKSCHKRTQSQQRPLASAPPCSATILGSGHVYSVRRIQGGGQGQYGTGRRNPSPESAARAPLSTSYM